MRALRPRGLRGRDEDGGGAAGSDVSDVCLPCWPQWPASGGDILLVPETMISTWLADTALETFLTDHFQQEPLVRPNTAAAAVPLLGWETLRGLLDARPDV